MFLKNFLVCNPSCFLFIDPSIRRTGVAVYHCKLGDDGQQLQYQVIDHGLVKPIQDYDNEELYKSVQAIADQVKAYVIRYKVKHVWIEQPAQTVHGSNGMNRMAIVARAQSVFKLFAAWGGLINMLMEANCEIHPVLPLQWEPSKKARKGQPIKEWSLEHASLCLHRFAVSDRIQKLTTSDDENIADAINMGYVILKKMFQGDLAM